MIQDGKISQDEADGKISEAEATDGKISEAEAVACLAKQGLSPEVAKCIFGKVDADKSGKVEEEEFNKFKMADAGSCFAGGPPAPPPPQAKVV
ncbi:hypothetical protein T484DRAFT_1779070 [Baffinella frigidus]|nr:hypothetical protein T484DRAFT_1779070 [Cryptophyta sp. CCMP2293]